MRSVVTQYTCPSQKNTSLLNHRQAEFCAVIFDEHDWVPRYVEEEVHCRRVKKNCLALITVGTQYIYILGVNL